MSFHVFLICDATCRESGRCTTEHSPARARTARTVRRRLKKQGWHRTRDGRDICPDCWTAGQR